MKTLVTKSLKKPTHSHRIHFIILYALCLGLIGTTGILTCYVRTLWRNTNADQSVIRGYIHDAVEGLYKDTTIDPKEKKQYVYEASVRFALPATNLDTFRYGYLPNSDDVFKESITVTADSVLRTGYSRLQGPNIFDYVPQYQQCSKMFVVAFSPDDPIADDFSQVTTKKLADGRTAYLYRNQKCTDFYANNSVAVVDYQKVLESIESY